MSHKTLRVLSLLFVMGAGTLAFGATPAFACHEATGWCCVGGEDGHPFCCYFEDDEIDEESCDYVES